MRIVVTSKRFHADGHAILAAAGAEVRSVEQEETPEGIAALLRAFDPHGMVSRGVALTAAAIDGAPSLRAIAKTGVGVDNIDLDAATRRGIPVLSNIGGNSRSVAEHCLALMFGLARNVARHDALMRSGIWSRFRFSAHELQGKRLGIVGYGQSAQHLAGMAEALGMEVSAFAPRYRQGAPKRPAASLEALLQGADIVSLNCPLTSETRGMIGSAAFAAMRPGAWLINVSRGAVVDEAALLDALCIGRLGGAGLDVHAHEPMPPTHPLFATDNVVLTPHVAGSTLQSGRRAHIATARNLVAVLEGRAVDPLTIVNADALARRQEASNGR